MIAHDPFAREKAIEAVRVNEWVQVFGPY